MSGSEDVGIRQNLAGLVNSPNADIRLCVSKIAGESKNAGAAEELFNNIRAYQVSAAKSKGHCEENLKEKVAAINSIWALGEIGDAKMLEKLFHFYAAAPSFAIEKGDIIYSGGQTGISLAWMDELPLGHSGIFVGTKKKNRRIATEIVDSVPNYFKYG